MKSNGDIGEADTRLMRPRQMPLIRARAVPVLEHARPVNARTG
jgi:hypothetical protein